jgi:uncharacterized Rossmann fold enzyme
MELHPLSIGSKCVMSDTELFRHIGLAMERSLPEIGLHHEHDGVAVLVASGPSVEGQLDSIKKARDAGHPIIALKDAHDWLIERGVIPDYAVAIDPQEHRWNCFKLKHPQVKYFIASQCHPAMFEHLKGHEVYLWHLYVKKGQTIPPGRNLIAGGSTTGMRSITLFYTMGFRKFELYGYDSCLKDGVLRVNGDKSSEAVVVTVVVDGKLFQCNPAMAAQAQEFEKVFDYMQDAQVVAHGEGLIAAILEARTKVKPLRISFIHKGGPGMASYRYRAQIPAGELANASVNDHTADVLIFAKPMPEEVEEVKKAKSEGKRVIVDFCDPHFHRPHYLEMAKLADAVSCPTEKMAEIVKAETGKTAAVIADPYEFAESLPHCNGTKLLWFGHGSNLQSLGRLIPDLAGKYPLKVVSNVAGTIPWSLETMYREFQDADIVILPATAEYKSANRAIEAVRQGCFVVAEPHPSLESLPGIWIGDIKEGIEWSIHHPEEVRRWISEAQSYITEKYSPRTLAYAWRTIILGQSSTSVPETSTGKGGSMSTSTRKKQTSDPTCGISILQTEELASL